MPITPHTERHPAIFPYRLWFLIGLVCLFFLASCNGQNEADNLQTAVNQAKIEVSETAFYRITAKELADAGIPFDSFSADSLRLTTQDQSIPFYFDENGLVFFGQAPTSRYTASRPYILQVGEGGVLLAETAGSQAATASHQRTTTNQLHLEENLLYESQARRHGIGDVWFWETIRQGQRFPIPFELPAVADGAGALTVQLIGVSYNAEVENDHDLDILINDTPLGTIQFDGETVYTATVSIPAGTLKQGENELVLDNTPEGAAFLDIVQLNWVQLAYTVPTTAVNDQLMLAPTTGEIALSGFSELPLLFDISDSASPQQLIAADISKDDLQLSLAPDMQVAAIGPDGFTSPVISPLRQSNWHDTSQQADLIILTTAELAPALAPLVAAREAEGLRVSVVPVGDIYDEFGGGAASPDSLKQFITYAYENWQPPRPRYLLLVGDATSDYRNYLGMAPQNIVPAPMVAVSYSGETVSDSVLADTDGDGRPNMAVGRWPVNTAAEVASLVERTLAYEQGTAVATAFFAADGTEAQFTQVAQTIANHSQLPEESVQILTGPQAEEVTAILNQGAWLATYIGHGSLRQWGKDDVFTQEAITDLSLDMPPIIVQLTCLTGLFTQPEQTSLTEMLLTHEAGPVFSVAATSLTLSANQEPFASSFIQHLNDPTVARIGDAFQAAKLSLNIENQGLREISDTFALFGDPSAHIVRPQP